MNAAAMLNCLHMSFAWNAASCFWNWTVPRTLSSKYAVIHPPVVLFKVVGVARLASWHWEPRKCLSRIFHRIAFLAVAETVWCRFWSTYCVSRMTSRTLGTCWPSRTMLEAISQRPVKP